MNTISELRASLNAELDNQASALGEHSALSASDKNTVSYAIDGVNETFNPTLGTRPH